MHNYVECEYVTSFEFVVGLSFTLHACIRVGEISKLTKESAVYDASGSKVIPMDRESKEKLLCIAINTLETCEGR